MREAWIGELVARMRGAGMPIVVLELAACSLVWVTLVAYASASPGDLDARFSEDGKLTMDLNGRSMAFEDVVRQPGGKVLTAGWADTGDSVDFVLARFARDGSLDPSFSSDGIETTDFGGDDRAFAVGLQADGKAVVAGQTYRSDPGPAGTMDFALVRYHSDGSIDGSFSGDGKLTTDLAGGWDLARDVDVAPDGEIVAAGIAETGTISDQGGAPTFAYGVARYRPDGSPDPSFSDDGATIARPRAGESEAYGVVVQDDGRIVVAGEAGRFTLLRLMPNGDPDTSFSRDGMARTRFGRGGSGAQAVALDRKQRLIAVGSAASGRRGKDTDFAVARYRRSGRLDTSFSRDGRTTTGFGRAEERASDVAIYPKGKIVAVGATGQVGGALDFALARYRAGGRLDRGFGSRGKVTTRFRGCSGANGVTLVGKGDIVAAGRVFVCDPIDEVTVPAAVARYEG